MAETARLLISIDSIRERAKASRGIFMSDGLLGGILAHLRNQLREEVSAGSVRDFGSPSSSFAYPS